MALKNFIMALFLFFQKIKDRRLLRYQFPRKTFYQMQFPRDQIRPDAEVPERTLGLSTPVAVRVDLDRTETVGLAAGGFISGCF